MAEPEKCLICVGTALDNALAASVKLGQDLATMTAERDTEHERAEQLALNCRWLIQRIDDTLDVLPDSQNHYDTWQSRANTLLIRAKAERAGRERAEAQVGRLKRRLDALMPLFEEARDALPALSAASIKLHGIRLDLAARMDEVGVPELWAKREAALAENTLRMRVQEAEAATKGGGR